MASDDVYCLAEPSGLGAPYFRSDLGLAFSEPVGHLPAQRVALLLQEGIVFRVARILEDFQRAFGIERAYLSGGLSSLPCLQQGIARCASLPVYRLQQVEASLGGAGHLAAGTLRGTCGAEKIKVSQAVGGLSVKYRGWKSWLDTLLKS